MAPLHVTLWRQSVKVAPLYALKKYCHMCFFEYVQETMTKRQQEIYDFLRKSARETGLMPSTREIQHHFGFSSQTAAMNHLRALERQDVIQRLPGKARAVIFPEDLDRAEIVDIPIYGNIAAGMAQESDQMNEGKISVDVQSLGGLSGKGVFALKVRGDSMVDAQICEGDIVLLQKKVPRSGDVVAALMDGESTLKRYLMRDGVPYLKAENEQYPELHPLQELIVQGVMVALWRVI